MTTQRRIQMSRRKPWRQLAPDAVIVARGKAGEPWGNPHPVSDPCPECDGRRHTRDEAIALYREHLLAHPDLVDRIKRELAGRDLACWCKPDEACHADLLLKIANEEPW